MRLTDGRLARARSSPACAQALRARSSIRIMASAPAAPKPSVALVGTGLMGGKMASRLARVGGFPVVCWNRTASKLEGLGLPIATTPAEAVQQASVVLIMLADAPAIRAVILDDPAVKALLPGRTVLMMSTIGPAESKLLAADVTAAGAQYIECPVLGSLPEVESGTLQVFVLSGLSKQPRQLGGFGAASAMKLALNQLIVSETLAFSASLGLVRKASGDEAVGTFMEILRASALYAPTFDKKLDKYLSRDFGKANFPTKHLLKDARLFCREAEALGMNAGLQRAAEALCVDACKRPELVEADYSAVYEAVVHPGEGSST